MAKVKLSTTAKGLGYRHQQAVARLFEGLTDGSACDWCGRPRWRDRTRNWDYDPKSTNPAAGKLQGDHEGVSRSEAIRRGMPIPLPNRLLHGECNRQRGDGANDHLAVTGNTRSDATDRRLMPWPA